MFVQSSDAMTTNKEKPLYLKVKLDILNRLETGEWREGDKLPIENDLVEYYQTSRATIRHALSDIETEGLIERHPGIGTIVSKGKVIPELLKISSFTDDMKQRGMEPKTINLDINFEVPPRRVREGLNLLQDEKVWTVRRLRFADNEPMGLHDLYIPPDLKISSRDLQNTQSYYSLLLNQYNLKPSYGKETLCSTTANEQEAELLQIKYGDPLMLIWRVTYASDNSPIEAVKMLYVGRRYEYFLNLYADDK